MHENAQKIVIHTFTMQISFKFKLLILHDEIHESSAVFIWNYFVVFAENIAFSLIDKAI